jgi:2-iminobutanoate/2-iminopropanoate deaminase
MTNRPHLPLIPLCNLSRLPTDKTHLISAPHQHCVNSISPHLKVHTSQIIPHFHSPPHYSSQPNTPKMPLKEAVLTSNAPPPLPFFSQAIKCNGMVYCSGSIGTDPTTLKLVEGGVADRTRQSLKNLAAVLEAAGSGIDNVVKVNIFLTNMVSLISVLGEMEGGFNGK